MRRINMVGKQFHRWLVLDYAGLATNLHSMWRCQCACGLIKVINGQSLRRGATKSCGCLRDEKQRLESGKAGFNSLFTKYKKAASKRKLSFRLSKKLFRELTAKNCFYCGAPPQKQTRTDTGMYGSYKYNGIDRKNSRFGYSKGNCVSCCTQCNIAKNVMSPKEFIALAKRIIEHCNSESNQ